MNARAPFSAALIAGGKSRRMGRDKCLLEFHGMPLWQRQLAVLAEMGPAEILISCRKEQAYVEFSSARIVPDAWSDAGPMGGIASVLQAASQEMVLMLAVDMPEISAPFLDRLFTHVTPGCGAVIKTPRGFEPLAAIYPKSLGPLAVDCVNSGKFRLQDFVLSAVEAGMMRSVEISEQEAIPLMNLNTPGDLPQF